MQIEVALARNYDVLVNVLQECMSKEILRFPSRKSHHLAGIRCVVVMPQTTVGQKYWK